MNAATLRLSIEIKVKNKRQYRSRYFTNYKAQRIKIKYESRADNKIKYSSTEMQGKRNLCKCHNRIFFIFLFYLFFLYCETHVRHWFISNLKKNKINFSVIL